MSNTVKSKQSSAVKKQKKQQAAEVEVFVKPPFMYRRKDMEPIAPADMKLEELQEELAHVRKRKANLEYVENKLAKELMNRLKVEETPKIIIKSSKQIA